MWIVVSSAYACYYVVGILALPEEYDAYARNWKFQLLMFSLFRLPWLVLALCLLVAVIVVLPIENKTVPRSFVAAVVILLAAISPSVASARRSEASRILRICTQLYGATVDWQRHQFAVNEFYVLGLKFNARGSLIELEVSPKYFFEEAHADWAEPDNFTYLSKSQYDAVLEQIDTIKPRGALIKSSESISVVTNMTAPHREIYRRAMLDWGEIIDLRRSENAPLLVRWIRVHYYERNRRNRGTGVLTPALIPTTFPFEQFSPRMGQAKENLSVAINDLRKTPTAVVLDGKSLSLSTYLWRDFMPSIPPMSDGKPMIAVLKVATSDKKSFPSGVRIDRAWVLFGEQMWETSEFKEQSEGPANHKDWNEKWMNCPDSPVCEAVARGGPKWGPGVFVDVVVQLTDREGRHHLLRAPKQYVARTD